MNYEKVYNQIIERARIRIFDVDQYVEMHHVVPRCTGGTNSNENLVKLTAREHFICHWLLSRMFIDNVKLAYAFRTMCSFGIYKGKRYIPSSRAYREAKERVYLLGLSDEHKKNISKSRLGYKMPESTKQKLREINLGKKHPRSDEYRQKCSAAQKGKKKEMTDARLAHYENMRGRPTGKTPPNKGIPASQETIDKIKKSLEGKMNPMKDPEVVRKNIESRAKNKEEKIRNGTYVQRVPWNKGKRLKIDINCTDVLNSSVDLDDTEE